MGKTVRHTLTIYFLFFFLMQPLAAVADSPLDDVQTHVNEVLAVLRSHSSQDDTAEKAKKEKLRSIANRMFDFDALSKWSMGRNWEKLNEEQQKEFVELYKKILEKVYMDRLLTYTDEQVLFTKDIMFTEDKAEVRTVVKTASKEIPINYRVLQKDGKWLVYDVIIEGVSLVKNYRSQFNSILLNNSPEELLKMLRDKAAKT